MSPAQVSHSSVGRLRIHVERPKGDAGFFENVEQSLAQCEGVDAIQTNPRTGSVLILHHSQDSAILRFAQESELFEVDPIEGGSSGATPSASDHHPPKPSVTGTIHKRAERVDHTLQRLSRGRLNLTSATALSLIGLSVYRAYKKGPFLPDGGTLLWYAARLLTEESGNGRHGNGNGG